MLAVKQTEYELKAEVVERLDAPGVWSVEAIGEDGEIYMAIFPGPNSRERAEEYRTFKFGV